MPLRYCLIFLLAFSSTLPLPAQTRKRSTYVVPKLEDLPRRPLDTLQTEDPDTRIILYTNNTWEYYRPELRKLDTLPAYAEHWDTTGIFAYKSISYESLPAVIDLNLVGDLSEFRAPIVGKVFSKYGPRRRRSHNGVDIPLKIGEPIYATFAGKIRYARFNSGGFGNLVIVRHYNGLETWYAHLSKLNVEVGDYVKAGQVIGFGGNTGRSRGPHLHFEMRYQDQSFDPEFIVDFETGNLRYQTFALEKSFFNIRSRASEILEEDDDDDYPLLAGGGTDGDAEANSEEILRQIEKAQQRAEQPKSTSTATVSQSGAVYHTIRQGDMLGKLAIRYGVSIDQICRLNGITRTTILALGRKLRIK